MGLDMYLDKRSCVQNWDHMKPEHRHVITVTKGDGSATTIKPERISYIIEQVAYWRKANAIHKWFVDNVQDGKDDCGDYYVSREQLQTLKALCDKVLAASAMKPAKVANGYTITPAGQRKPILEDGEVIADPQTAAAILPTASGFFFGSTDYDQYYIADIRETSEALAALLAEPESGEFYYHSSW
jgi:hypothetical protein